MQNSSFFLNIKSCQSPAAYRRTRPIQIIIFKQIPSLNVQIRHF